MEAMLGLSEGLCILDFKEAFHDLRVLVTQSGKHIRLFFSTKIKLGKAS